MRHSAQASVDGGTSVFDKSCAYCGARFRVRVPPATAADHAEGYACPECGKNYQLAASQAPQVQLLQHRCDGKRDRYQETMF